jgi:hypothetical protein
VGDDPPVDEELSAPDAAGLLTVDSSCEAIVFQGTAEADRFGASDVGNLRGKEQAGEDTGVTLAGCGAPVRSGTQPEHGGF